MVSSQVVQNEQEAVQMLEARLKRFDRLEVIDPVQLVER